MMKFAPDRPYSDPEKAARKLIEIANSVETTQDRRIYIEEINRPFLYEHKGSTSRVQGWPRSSDRARLAGAARIRDLREVHSSGARSCSPDGQGLVTRIR
jgi:hypothetical protein